MTNQNKPRVFDAAALEDFVEDYVAGAQWQFSQDSIVIEQLERNIVLLREHKTQDSNKIKELEKSIKHLKETGK